MNLFRRLAFALLFMPAMAQTNMREINVISDQSDPQGGGDIEFFQGESVRLNIFLRRGNASVSVPSGALPVWKAWVDGTPGTLYINVTGTVVNASLGQLRVELTPAQSNATNQEYKAQVQLYNSTTYMGVAWTGDLEILYSPAATGLAYVGTTAPAITELLAGSNVTVTTNGSSRTVAASDTLGGLSPVAGRILYGTGSAWATLAAGTSGQVLQSNGAAAPSWGSAGAGDIEGVTAGTGLSGGGTSGTVTLSLANTAVTSGSYGPTTLTVDAQGRLTAAATSSSAAIQAALGAVYLPLADGGEVLGEVTLSGGAWFGSAGDVTFENGAYFQGAGIEMQSGADILLGSGSVITGNGSGLTNLDATDLSGDIPAASFGEERLNIPATSFAFASREQVGFAEYTLATGSNAIAVPCYKSANSSEQDFVIRSAPIVVPRGFVAFKTSGAIDIDWIADSTTVADIRGIRLVRYSGATPTVLYSDAITRNVGTINTPANVSIDRSAFSSTTIAEGDHLVLEVTGTVEDSNCLAILHACIHSE